MDPGNVAPPAVLDMVIGLPIPLDSSSFLRLVRFFFLSVDPSSLLRFPSSLIVVQTQTQIGQEGNLWRQFDPMIHA